MEDTPPHLKAFEEIEKAGIPDLLEVPREEGIDGVRYALWDATGWHRDYSPATWRDRDTEEQLSLPSGHLYYPEYGFTRLRGRRRWVLGDCFRA